MVEVIAEVSGSREVGGVETADDAGAAVQAVKVALVVILIEGAARGAAEGIG